MSTQPTPDLPAVTRIDLRHLDAPPRKRLRYRTPERPVEMCPWCGARVRRLPRGDLQAHPQDSVLPKRGYTPFPGRCPGERAWRFERPWETTMTPDLARMRAARCPDHPSARLDCDSCARAMWEACQPVTPAPALDRCEWCGADCDPTNAMCENCRKTLGFPRGIAVADDEQGA